MGTIAQFPNPLPLPAVGRVAALLIERHSPTDIANAIDVLVDLLDFLGGDPDLEEADPLEDDDPREQDDPPEDDDADEDNGDREQVYC